jgi:transglutaminase-like putative cysteine protease
MRGGLGWSALLIVLLTLVIARSTATAGWVDGIDVVTFVALGGALVMGVLALSPLPWGAGLGAGLIAGPIVAAVAAGPALRALHPEDALSPGLASTWWSRLSDGSAGNDPSFYLFMICLLMWVTGGWLSWCVLKWRRPMLGLVPGAAAFATNVLNAPANQNGYTLAVLVLTLALLLWTNYTGSIANATRARVKLTGDARWDFWENGLVAMAALIVIAILLPPLSTVDRTVEAESSFFSSWAKIQQRISNATIRSNNRPGTGITGFSTAVSLNRPLKQTKDIVFTYTYSSAPAPAYFRGVNVTLTLLGEWRYPTNVSQQILSKSQTPFYVENYKKLAVTAVTVKMVSAPAGYGDLLFYPGTLYRVDRDSTAYQVSTPPTTSDVPSILAIDRLTSKSPPVSTGTYAVTMEYPTATEADLKQAGTDYPAWLEDYRTLPPDGSYRSRETTERIHQLALDVTQGAVTPYDKAKAIEAYLRNPNNFKYTLTPDLAPDGTDRLGFFLFDSKAGYCQFFASAMGDMLRSLGIPTRLVNGFGPGKYDAATNSYIVRGEDAHTWVETYFPTYGWITFEPTPDGVYSEIQRGVVGTNPCLRDNNCDTPTGGSTGPVGAPSTKPGDLGPQTDPGAIPGAGGGFTFRAPDAGTLTKIVGVLLALVLLILGAAARYLRPRKVMTVWKRTQVLARLAGAQRRAGETPFELGRRLAREFPEASEPVRSLANGFVVSAYAPPELAKDARASVMEAWTALRPMLLRRVASRLRLAKA